MSCCMCEMFRNFVYYVGLYTLSTFLYDHAKDLAVLAYIKWTRARPISLRERYGEWAVVTGSTDGIGKAYARELARRGINVVLISRTEAKLKAVAEEIEKDFKVKTKYIVADFAQGQSIYKHIDEELGDLRIGILVNNVGTNTKEPGYFANAPVEEVWQMMHINMGAMVHLCHLFLHRMHNANIKGLIVNVCSFTEMNPIPYLNLYAASKAFAKSFTESLREEAQPWGITVQALSPWFVATKLIEPIPLIANGNVLVPKADEFTRSAVSTVGVLNRTTGHFWHAVQNLIVSTIPWQLRAIIFKQVMLTTVPTMKKAK